MSSKRNIVVNLLNFVSGEIAGAGVFTKNIFQLWLVQMGSDTSITLLHSSAIDVYEVFGIKPQPSITSEKINITNFFARILYEQIILPFKIRKFDVYFSPTPVVPLISWMLKGKTKLIITIHDMIPFFIRDKYGFLRSKYVKLLSKYGARVADRIITVSENSKKDICRITGVSSDKITIVYNFYPGSRKTNSVKYDKYFISISTIEPGKNIENAMKGFKLFLKKTNQPNFKFYWIGKIGWGYKRSELDEMISELGLENNFYLLGFVDETKKKELLNACTAMVYLSHYEGFGLPVLEGLYFDKPAVVSNTSSLPEVIGKAGILCDKESANDIADALTKITLHLQDYVKEIPGQLEKFNEEVQISKFLEVIEVN